MIKMGKKYKTRNGLPVRILCNDFKNDTYTVVAAVLTNHDVEIISFYTDTGEYIPNSIRPDDLIEVTPYDNFKEDDLCVVWTNDKQIKEFRYFALVKGNLPYVFDNGKTSFTASPYPVEWPNCRKATEEEIRTKTIKD